MKLISEAKLETLAGVTLFGFEPDLKFVEQQCLRPFVESACEVLGYFQISASRGEPQLASLRSVSAEVTVVVPLSGDLYGVALLEMDERVAGNLARAMVGREQQVLDDLALSALGELGNLIAGRAAVKLESYRYICRISPPLVIVGEGLLKSDCDMHQLAVPVMTPVGTMRLGVSLHCETDSRGGG